LKNAIRSGPITIFRDLEKLMAKYNRGPLHGWSGASVSRPRIGLRALYIAWNDPVEV
jgi:hypothetical protein